MHLSKLVRNAGRKRAALVLVLCQMRPNTNPLHTGVNGNLQTG